MQENLTLSRSATDLPTLLSQVIQCVQKLGGEIAPISRRIVHLSERLTQGRFHLAVLGQFKRGKSTLINALLGEAVLPAAIVPLTAIPTFIRHGREFGASVLFQDGRTPEKIDVRRAEELNAFLSSFVTEKGNPENRLGVSHVEVTHPASLLEKGVVLIDTPGIGSTYRHNTEATLNFLPQCDAALFLVSADPPITEVELEFLELVQKKVPRLFFILNKMDYLELDERRVALEFLQNVLTKQGKIEKSAPFFCVSAKQGLKARLTDNVHGWQQSGMEKIDCHLVDFLACEKLQALGQAVASKACEEIDEVLMRLRLAKRSLLMPLDELKQKLETFERKIEEIRRERQVIGDLAAGDHKRMSQILEDHSEQLRQKARCYLKKIVAEIVERESKNLDQQAIQQALAEAIPGYFERHSGLTTEMFRQQISEALNIHQKSADKLIETIRRTAANLFDVPYHAPESSRAFEMVREPYWVTRNWSSALSPITEGLVDHIVPLGVRRRRMLKRLDEQIISLVRTNVENLRWATLQSLDQTFRRFGSAISERLVDTLDATHGAINAAIKQRQQHSEAVSQEVLRLETGLDELDRLQTALAGK